MKFGKRYTKGTVFMAMLNGVFIGIAAIAVIYIIIGTNGKKVGESPETELPTTGPAPTETETPTDASVEPLRLFARQHGVFSSSESAATFLAADSSLSSAAIIQVGDKYYVWSSVGLSDAEIMDSEREDTYRKEFNANTAACSIVGAKVMRDVLISEDIAKIKFLESENEDEKAVEFKKHIDAITAFTSDLRVIRLHLLVHYSSKEDCVKISF